MITKTLTVATSAAVSNGDGYVNGNTLATGGNMLFPIAIQCPAALTTDTTFLIEWEYATGLWSELKAENGASDPKIFSANATVQLSPMAASLLKDKNVRVKLTTNQAADRAFILHYGVL